MAEGGKNMVSRSAATFMAVAALAVGVFIGVMLAGELGERKAQPVPGAAPGPATQSAPQGMPAQKIDPAILEMEAKVAQNPNDVAAWTSLGHAYFDSNMPGKAIAAYQKSLALRPGDADVLTDMGTMQRAAGQPQQALQSYDQAIAANPRHFNARLNKGIVLLHDLGDRAGAIAAWEGLLSVNPDASMQDGRKLSSIVQELKAGNGKGPGS